MKISLNWIKDYTELPRVTIESLVKRLTLHVCEVEHWQETGVLLNQAIVSQIKAVRPHPNAEKLQLVTIFTGDQELEVVCGATNFAPSDKVAYLPVGTTLPDGKKLTAKKVRGIVSPGMLAAEDELDMSSDHAGLLILPTTATVGTKLSTLFPDVLDWVLTIDNKSITHRPDLWGHYGFARELSVLYGVPLKPYETAPLPIGEGKASINIQVKAKSGVTRLSTQEITGVKVQPSPDWIRWRLHRIGLRSINNLVDISNYCMLDLGQPMHVFDRDCFNEGSDLIVDYAKKDSSLMHLYGDEISLSSKELVFLYQDSPMSLAGVIGGMDSGVTDSSVSIIVEAGNWDATLIRRTANKYNLRTDAAQRYEKSLDPNWTLLAIKRAWDLLLLSCPQAVLNGPLKDYYPNPLQPRSVAFSPDRCALLLLGSGDTTHDLSKEVQKNILVSLGFEVSEQKSEWSVQIPSWRQTRDMLSIQDLVEEVGRIWGYQKIVGKSPKIESKPRPTDSRFVIQRTAKRICAHLGYYETLISPFTNHEQEKLFFPDIKPGIGIKNPLVEGQTELRQSPISGMFASLQANAKEHNEISLFSCANTYLPNKGIEHHWLTILYANSKGTPATELFYCWKTDVMRITQSIVGKNAILEPKHLEQSQQLWLPSFHFSIVQNNESLGFGGRMHPAWTNNFDLPYPIFYAQWDLDEIVKYPKVFFAFQEPAKYPPVLFELTLVVKPSKPFLSVVRFIKQCGMPEIDAVDYKSTYNTNDKKHLSIIVTFRSPHKTFSPKEISNLQQKLMQKLESADWKLVKG